MIKNEGEMQIEKVKMENLLREYNVTVPANDINKSIENKLVQLSKKLKVPGFRPGKVPLSIVKKNHGQSILGEVLDSIIQKTSIEAISKEGLRPAMQPKIEILKFEEGKDLQYKMQLEILPDVPKVEFTNIKIEKPKVVVQDKDIDDGLKRIAAGHKHYDKAERAAKEGDAVNIDFKGFVDDQPFAGGEGKNYRLELGSNTFIPGFEEQLIGSKAREDVTVNVTFPEDYHVKTLAGKLARFEVKVHDVLSVSAHDKIDEEFAKHMGFENLEKLQGAVKKQIEREINATIRVKVKKQLFDSLDEILNFDIPQQMTELEFKSVWDQVQNAIKANPDSEDAEKPEKDLEKEYRKMSERRVRLGIFLSDIGDKNSIRVSQDELRDAISAEAARYPGQEKKVFEFYLKNPAQMDSLKGPILEEKVVDFILEKVSLVDKEMTLEELRQEETEGEETESEGKKKQGEKKASAKNVGGKTKKKESD